MMLYYLRSSITLRFVVVCIGLLLLVQVPTSQARSFNFEKTTNTTRFIHQSQPDTPNACPPAPGTLPDVIERTEFCVYYNDANTTLAQATLVADHTEDYWERYETDFGFLSPAYTDKLEVRILNSAGCNGGTWWEWTYLEIYNGCFSVDEDIQVVAGHELFHRVQYSYDGVEARWFKEGTARAIQDNVFVNIDDWDDALTSVFSFNTEANNYLVSTNADITSDPMRYMSALWWKYFSEQYGSTPAEPELGVDAFVALWESAATADDIAALNDALSDLGAGVNFDTAFRRFTVANYTKDLTGVPDGSYDYIDEDLAGNPAPYGPLLPVNGGTIDPVTSASWAAQVVSRYGARYYSATPDADCLLITADFHRSAGSTEFYHVVTQSGSTFKTHVEGSGTDWSQSFLNDGLTKVVAVVGGQGNSATVDVEFSCTTPVIEIELPNTLAPAYVGSSAGPDDIVVQVSVTNGAATGPVVSGLVNSDFKAEVGGIPALVTGGGFVQEEYFLLINTPAQAANGPYDLEIFLEEPGTTTVIASDTEADAVVYDNTNNDHVIITDVSGSMGWDGKMGAAQDAANLFIDASNSTEGLGLVSFSTDVVDTLPVEFATLPHRTDAHDEVNSYIPTSATSIGDGLNEAVNLLAGSVTGNARCQFTLLSDGMENSSLFWADVDDAVIATGCPVVTVAFGEASNELLMQDIATATGGASYYNDVYVSGNAEGGTTDATSLDLGDTYLYSLCEAQNCERLLLERGTISYGEVQTRTLTVDESVDSLTAVLDWKATYVIPLEPEAGGPFIFGLISPSGQVYDTPNFADAIAGHIGYQIDSPEVGEWQMIIVSFHDSQNKLYQVVAYGQSELSLNLLLPAVQEATTGDYMPLYAIWLPGGEVSALVTAPDGTPTVIPLHDDGQHGDGAAGDGFFSGMYTLVNQANEVPPVGENGVPNPPPPADEGAYRVRLLAFHGETRRETQGSFTVSEGADSDSDGVPDVYIETHCPSAPNSDADLDQLNCADEYFVGTDPNNSDTDSSGESDESEAIRHGLDPLTAGDDLIEAPEFVQTLPGDGSVLVTYDVKAEYASLLAYRATSPNGPWTLISSELPLAGSYIDATVANETTYYYCIQAIDAQDHWSAVVCSDDVTPLLDAVLPEAAVLINGGATSTEDTNVLLSFVPVGDAPDAGAANPFDDINEVLISNSPLMEGATWQAFGQDIPWELPLEYGWQTVYVRFRDINGNESVGIATATIFLDVDVTYLPIVIRP